LAVASARYAWIQQVTQAAVSHSARGSARCGTLDRIATHPIWGIPLAILIMLAAFAVAMVIAMPVMSAAMGGLPYLIEATGQALAGAPAWIGALLTDGLLPGIGMALAFPGFLFGMFLPMLTSLGCNVAGLLGSGVVDSWQQRMMTLVMAPNVPHHRPNWKTIRNFTWDHTKSFVTRGVTPTASRDRMCTYSRVSLMIAADFLPIEEIRVTSPVLTRSASSPTVVT